MFRTLALAVVLTLSAISAPEAQTVALIDVPQSLRPGGLSISVPDPSGAQIRVPNNADFADVTVTVALADKLSTGKTVSWWVYYSADNGQTWTFSHGASWQSYGPGGYFDSWTGTMNPDPKLSISLTSHRGERIRVVFLPAQDITAGLLVETR